jgi:hypothetical protein
MPVINGVKLSEYTLHYLEAMMWSTHVHLPVVEEELVDGCMDVEGGHKLFGISEDDHLDDHFEFDDFTSDSLRMAEADCVKFFEWIKKEGLAEEVAQYADDGHVAHDFWLTRNGHGAGFWDGDYDEELGEKLTEHCDLFVEQYVVAGEDGKLHLE